MAGCSRTLRDSEIDLVISSDCDDSSECSDVPELCEVVGGIEDVVRSDHSGSGSDGEPDNDLHRVTVQQTTPRHRRPAVRVPPPWAKFHKLKYGTELNQGDMKPPVLDEPGVPEVQVDEEAPFTSVNNITWKQGRQLLRQYLQEIGYTDTIIDVRSNRVRSLLGLNNNEETVSDRVREPFNAKRSIENEGRRTPAKKVQSSALAEAMILETEAAVMANFEFLSQADVEMDEDDDICDELDDTQDMDEQDEITAPKSRRKARPKVV
ncbi:hypothetical protein J6590_048733 [Homalodisca vitripennis]|nr:hypothetical protein J6590_048733 [Homalodisca vitripennis]